MQTEAITYTYQDHQNAPHSSLAKLILKIALTECSKRT